MPDTVGEEFDRKCQRAVKRVPTDSEEEDRKVIKTARQGYRSESEDEGIVRYQEVWVESYSSKNTGKEEEECHKK